MTRGCFSDQDCTDGPPCSRGVCQSRPGGGLCQYYPTCVAGPCETATCENDTCVRTPIVCGPCEVCYFHTGECGFACDDCERCDPNVGCVADTSQNGQSGCRNEDAQITNGICYDGQCQICLPLGAPCDFFNDRCCAGCRVDVFGSINDYICQCLPYSSFGCHTDADCCTGSCVHTGNPAGNVCE